MEQSIEQAGLRAGFHRVAGERWARLLHNGKTIPLEETSHYLAARGRGETPAKPRARKPSR